MTLTESSSISPWISGRSRAAILIFCEVAIVVDDERSRVHHVIASRHVGNK